MSDVPDHCCNCRKPLTGPYCARCGQKAQDHKRPLHTFFGELWGGFFSLDSRFWKTIRVLLTKPGFLTNVYNVGQRVMSDKSQVMARCSRRSGMRASCCPGSTVSPSDNSGSGSQPPSAFRLRYMRRALSSLSYCGCLGRSWSANPCHARKQAGSGLPRRTTQVQKASGFRLYRRLPLNGLST